VPLLLFVSSLNPIANAPRFILAALFLAARECDNIQLRLHARMLCWLICNGRNPTVAHNIEFLNNKTNLT
jgi:hypothetical protein